jgi:hypothetical protein
MSNDTTKIEYTIVTLDLQLGVIGGFYAILWGFFSFSLATFENFKK